jgi:transcriptional regulator with XRE-family HTH domain
MSVYIYTRADSSHQTDQQASACKAILNLHGLAVSKGGYRQEIGFANGDEVISRLIAHGKGDTIAVASPSRLHPNPLRLIELASQALANGVNLLVADQPSGRLDLNLLRSLTEPLTAQQNRIEALQKELQEKDAEHQREYVEFQNALEAQVASYLAARGVTLAHLLKPQGPIEGTSPVARPDEGRRVRELREQLHLSQTEAGALVNGPALDKSAVSRIETQGSGAPRYADLSSALEVEAILKSHEAKQRAKGINPFGAEPDPFEHITAAVRGSIQPKLSALDEELAARTAT